MFGRPFKVGRLLGFNVSVSWTAIVLVAFMSFQLAFQVPNFVMGLVVGALSVLALFASVLVHELGHSVVARKLGVAVAEIELHVFGGAAKMTSLPKSPRDEILIAGAGPLTSLALALVFWLVAPIVPFVSQLFSFLALANLVLGLFNLIPALPTDGGRIFRAAMTPYLGAYKATKIAVIVARAAAVALAVWAAFQVNLFGVAVAVFLWILSSRELRLARHLDGRRAPQAQEYQGSFDVLDRSGRVISHNPGSRETVSSAQRSYAQGSRVFVSRKSVFRGPDGRLWVVEDRAM